MNFHFIPRDFITFYVFDLKVVFSALERLWNSFLEWVKERAEHFGAKSCVQILESVLNQTRTHELWVGSAKFGLLEVDEVAIVGCIATARPTTFRDIFTDAPARTIPLCGSWRSNANAASHVTLGTASYCASQGTAGAFNISN